MRKLSNYLLFVMSLGLSSLTFVSQAATFTINSISGFENLNLSPGDVVIWQNGTYSDDERIVFDANGTSSNPITLKAESPGGVKFTGGLQMDISGNNVIVEGFHWVGGYGASNFIQFRNGTNYANNSTIQNCVIDGLGVEPGDAAEAAEDGAIVKHRWIVLYGSNNNVLNCSFLNKTTAGALVLVELEYNAEDNRCSVVGHTISNNYFYNYEKMDPTLSNSGDSETIRVGTSEFQNVDCQTVVSNNYFVSADGENEIITNKSDNNFYLNNTFRKCRGSLTLRHGSGATVSGNYFLGENVDGTGGIRIVDSDHSITNNYIQDCITVLSQAKWNNGITFMGGSTNSQDDCNSTSVSNGYQKSEDITVSNNTIVNTNAPLFYNGDKGTNANTGNVEDNLIFFATGNANTTNVITEDDTGDFDDIGSPLSYSGNVYGGSSLGQSLAGFSSANLTASANGEIYSISGASGKGANISSAPYTNSDVSSTVGACFVDANGNLTSNGNCSGGVTPTMCDVISEDNFDSNWGIWNDGGSDCRRNSNDAPYSNGATGKSIRLRDNTASSITTTDAIDLSGYSKIVVDFNYYARSMENGEDFWLQVSTQGGAAGSFDIKETWIRGTDFNNDERYFESVTIDGPFTSNTVLRFTMDASGSLDWVYLDDIKISAGDDCTGSSSIAIVTSTNSQPTSTNETETKAANSEIEQLDSKTNLYTISPNPFDNNIKINLEKYDGLSNVSVEFYNATGSTVLTRIFHEKSINLDNLDLPSGTYFMRINYNNGEYTHTEHVVKF